MMSETKGLTISLEDLRCVSCSSYLSCAPIQVLSDGNSICGNCSPLFANETTQRVLTLEAILGKVSFPCQFKQLGCEEELLFGCVDEHESECNFRCFDCPVLPNNCLWNGPLLEMYDHFANDHSDAVAPGIELKLEVNQNKEEILISEVDDVKFIMKYVYCAETSKLQYDVKYMPFDVEEVSCKIVLTNDIEEGYSITLKGNNCLPYNGDFPNIQNGDCLFLSNLLPVLNKPERILITMDLMVNKVYYEDDVSEEEKLIVDYDWLEKLRCMECKDYLTLPVYKSGSTAGFVCCSCKNKSADYKPIENNAILKLIRLANYPCRWRACEYVGKADNIRKHEQYCCYRMHACLGTNCEVIFRIEEAVTHLQEHGWQHFNDELVYKIFLSQLHAEVTCFSQKCSEVIVIQYNTNLYGPTEKNEYKHQIKLFGRNIRKIKAKVQFEHIHCKIKSPEFVVSSKKLFGINEMPHCFSVNNELTVTVKLQCFCSLCKTKF